VTGRRAPPAPALRIRRARLSDASALASVLRAAVRGVAPGTYPARTLSAWASLPALYHAWAMTAGGETVLVAALRGRTVGYAGLRGAELTSLFVRPSAARRGVASALLARAEALARRRGVRTLRVDAARSGLAFYRARGFSGSRRVRIPLPGGALAAVRLAKRLP
jgi:GNAT superfamily N-acetyltransferase